MKDKNVVEVRDVYKSFKSYFDKSHILKERILQRKRGQYEERQILRGISFSVGKGEAVGLIGCNGCGKSTMLKLLNRIIYPDSGEIYTEGRISSLLELGAGFHPDLSGYENIYLNAAVFGLTRREIDRRMDEIVRFSELKDYMRNPIRTYSSGMYMKLAFSVAINVDADILLIDEILGVGDVNFQKKCFEKLMEIKRQNTTIILVSHSMDQVERICDRSIWIADGKVCEEGIPAQVHRRYLASMEDRRLLQRECEEEERRRVRELVERERGNRKREKLQLEVRLETERQKDLLERAARERQRQESLLRETDESQLYRRDAERLELVVKEKNLEIQRLDSVIRQKELEKQSILHEKDGEILRLEREIARKQEENQRLSARLLEMEGL